MNDRKQVAVQIITNPQSDEPLTLTLSAPDSIHRGDMLNAVAVARGGTGGYVYSKAAGPAWLSVSAEGYVAGVPDTIQREFFTVHVEDSSSTVAEHVFSIDVVSRLIGKWVTPVDGEIHSLANYVYDCAVAGNTGAVTWELVDGNLPAGISLGAAGDFARLGGSPSGSGGISYFTLRATDAGSSDTLDIPMTITIHPRLRGVTDRDPDVPGITNDMDMPAITRGVPYHFTLSAIQGKPGPVRIKTFPGDDPPGFTMTAVAGKAGRVWPITIIVTDNRTTLDIDFQVRDEFGYDDAVRHFAVVDAQDAIQPQKNGTDVGVSGPTKINLVEGDGVSIEASNDGVVASYKISADAMPDAPSDGKDYARKDGAWDALGTAATHDVPASGDASATQVVLGNDSRLGGGGGGSASFEFALFDGSASTRYGSSTKLVCGGRYIDPSDPRYALTPTSTATLCMLLETTSAASAACGELFQKSGTGAPQVIAATTTTTNTTATLVTADVSAAINSTAPDGVFVVRIWTDSPNGLNQATCTGAWLEVTP